ncbi:DNA cytosine methyltransferase [Streptomyces sp. NPDC059506]|uniref:DNA cytosine methyltransferase n=1 Tax=Streptomyces TaxID=1883 RepID=UPI0022AA5280|nr:DNA cytosine methyltransferase [Streptomyces sp. HB2AG]MCZ2523863.1 DNA cytosine methyltransferase [Streptomyces sp. HB2AG]
MNTETPGEFTLIDLFSGCGGFTQGFRRFTDSGKLEKSPFRSVAAVEWEPAAAYTYAENFGEWAGGTEHIYLGDITEMPKGDLPKADVILGGPPCQGFSGLGKGDPDDPRNKLWRQYFEVVAQVHPKVFVIENVDRFRNSPEFHNLQLEFKKRGYTLKHTVLTAADYGAPQLRRRTIVIGTLDGIEVKFPRVTHFRDLGIAQEDRKSTLFLDADPDFEHLGPDEEPQKWVTVRKAFEGIPAHTSRTELPGERRISRKVKETGHLDSALMEILRSSIPGSFSTEELHIGRTPDPLSVARYAVIKEGQNRNALRGKTAHIPGLGEVSLSTESWDRHDKGSGDVMGRLHWDRPSVTIRTEFFKPEKGRYLHPVADRPITHLEAAVLQGFPLDFKWCGSKIQIARQIGNAVPVPMAEAIAGAVYRGLTGTGKG